ncbi:MAG TPA: hypothetical protein VIM84_03650 [Gemmatimonadales bacterium]
MSDESRPLYGVAYPTPPLPVPEPENTDGLSSFADLAAALTAWDIRSELTLHRAARECTLRLTAEQAAALAGRLLPPEGSAEDELGIALGLLDCLTEESRYNPCIPDHNGQCQSHTLSGIYEGACAQPQADAFLIRHHVRPPS